MRTCSKTFDEKQTWTVSLVCCQQEDYIVQSSCTKRHTELQQNNSIHHIHTQVHLIAKAITTYYINITWILIIIKVIQK